MFCQKCGKNIQDNEAVILDKRILCRECVGMTADKPLEKSKPNNVFCQRCGKNIPYDEAVISGEKMLCQECANTDDKSPNDSKMGNKKISVLLSIIAISALIIAMALILYLILPFILSNDNEQNDHEVKPAIVYDNEESDHDEHTTYHGKCDICREFILDEAFLPQKEDYANVMMFNHMSNTFSHEVLDKLEWKKSGFSAYVKIPDSERIEGLVPQEHDYVLHYYGDRKSNCLTQLYMYFEPENEDDVDDLYDAINDYYTDIYGVPYEVHESKGKEFGRTWHDEKELVSINTTIFGNCMAISLELLDDDAPWLQDDIEPAVTTEKIIVTSPKKTTAVTKRTTTTTKKTTTTTKKADIPYNCPSSVYFSFDYESKYCELQDTYFYDVDSDGKKETIAQYESTDQSPYYGYRIYESDGSYVDCVLRPGASSVAPIAVVYDNNIDEYYVAEIYMSCSNAGGGVTISNAITEREYAEYGYSSPGGVFESAIYRVNGSDVSEETARNYMYNIEIISCSDAYYYSEDIIREEVESAKEYINSQSSGPIYTETNYLITVNDYLPIYEGPGYSYPVAEYFTELTRYTIVEECRLSNSEYDVWGKLKSGAGWVNIYDVQHSYY